MAYSTPKTDFATNDVVTAPQMNDIGNNLLLTAPALFTAKGDLLVATGAHVPTRLAVGSNHQALIANSAAVEGVQWGIPGILLTRDISDTGFNNSAAENTLFSYAMGGGTLPATGGFLLRMYGTWRNNKGSSGTNTIKCKLTNTIITLALTLSNNATTDRHFELEFTLFNTTASAQTAMARALFYHTAGGTLDAMDMEFGTLTRDTTTGQTIEVSSQMSAADATFSITKKMVTITLFK